MHDLWNAIWESLASFNQNHPGVLNAICRVALILLPFVSRWISPALRRFRESLVADVVAARSRHPQKQTSVALLTTFMVVGPVLFFVYSLTGSVPPFVEAWTVAVASVTSAYGLWIAARLVWQVLHQPTSLFATH